MQNDSRILAAGKLSVRSARSELARVRESRRLRDRARLEAAWTTLTREVLT